MCKYPLLFRELLASTPQDHSDYQNVSTTKKHLEEVTEGENKKSAEESNFRLLAEFNDTVSGYEANPSEDWYFYDEVLAEKNSSKKMRVYILSRSIIITKTRHVLNKTMNRKENAPKKKPEIFITNLDIDKIEFMDTGDLEITFMGTTPYSFICPRLSFFNCIIKLLINSSLASKLAWKSNLARAIEEGKKTRQSVVHVTSLNTAGENPKRKSRKLVKRSNTDHTSRPQKVPTEVRKSKRIEKVKHKDLTKTTSVKTVKKAQTEKDTAASRLNNIDEDSSNELSTKLNTSGRKRLTSRSVDPLHDRKIQLVTKLKDVQSQLSRYKSISSSTDPKDVQPFLEKLTTVSQLLQKLDKTQTTIPTVPAPTTPELLKPHIQFCIKTLIHQLSETKNIIIKSQDESIFIPIEEALNELHQT